MPKIVSIVLGLLLCSPLFGQIDPLPEGVDVNMVNTAKSVEYLSRREKKMIVEINLVRHYPKAYLKLLDEFISGVRSELKKDQIPSEKAILERDLAAATDLRNELLRMEPLSLLHPHPGMDLATKAHSKEELARGFISDLGDDGSMPWHRLMAAAPDLQYGNESHICGVRSNRYTLLLLLLDRESEKNFHRRMILDPKWAYVTTVDIGRISDEYPYCWNIGFGQAQEPALPPAINPAWKAPEPEPRSIRPTSSKPPAERSLSPDMVPPENPREISRPATAVNAKRPQSETHNRSLEPAVSFNLPLTHIVVEGESLWKLSRHYKVSVSDIKQENQLTDNLIYPGQKLTIPKP